MVQPPTQNAPFSARGTRPIQPCSLLIHWDHCNAASATTLTTLPPQLCSDVSVAAPLAAITRMASIPDLVPGPDLAAALVCELVRLQPPRSGTAAVCMKAHKVLLKRGERIRYARLSSSKALSVLYTTRLVTTL